METKNACAVTVEDSGLSSRLNSMPLLEGVPMDAQTACPACGASLEVCARLVPKGGAKAVRYGLCPKCGYMGYIDRPTQKWIIDFYSKDWDQEFIRTPEQMREDADIMMRKGGKISRYLAATLVEKLDVDKTKAVCEIGTGYGLVLEYFKRNGFTKLIGVENSKHRAELVKKVFGFEVLHGGFEEESVQEGLRAAGPIGLFFSHHVFEHTYHPADIIRKVSALQKEGDHIIFSLPNADGEHIQYALLYVLHLHSFTKESLEALFNRYGYEMVADASPDRTNIIVAAKKVAQPQARYRTSKDHRAEFVKRFRKGFRLDEADGKPYAIYWEQKPEEADTAIVEMHAALPALTRFWWLMRKGLDYVKSRWLERVTAGHRLLLRASSDAPADGACEIRFDGDVLFYIK